MPAQKKTVQTINADVFVAIAHPVRRRILERLAQEEVTANDLADPFKISRSAVSQHLGILLEAGLVERQKQGREQHYRLRPDNLNRVQQWISQFDKFWTEKLDALESVLDEMAEDEEQEND